MFHVINFINNNNNSLTRNYNVFLFAQIMDPIHKTLVGYRSDICNTFE